MKDFISLIWRDPTFPKQIRLFGRGPYHEANADYNENNCIAYDRRVYCYMDVEIVDDSVYKCVCSNCGESSNPWDKYCRHCGAKSLGEREVQDEEAKL